MSTPTPSTPPPKSESLASRFSRFTPKRALTLSSPRPASPQTTTESNGRPTPARSNTRDSGTPPSKRSILTAAFTPRKSGLGSSRPSTDAVDQTARKSEDPVPVETTEPAKEPEPAKEEAKATPGHARVRSGSTVSTHSSHGPLTPPPASQVAEPVSIPKADADPVSDSPHEGASVASRSPSRLRRQVSNLSRRSLSGSMRRLSLLGPGTSSPPAVETTNAIGQMEARSRSPSLSETRHLAMSPEPVSSDPEPVVAKAPEPVPEAAEPVPAPAPVEAPQVAPTAEPLVEEPAAVEEPAPAPVEAPAPALAEVPAPAPTETPQQEAPRPQTPSKLKPSMSRNASTTSLTKSPGSAEKPEPKRRGTLTNWARRSLDRKPSIDRSGSPFRPPSRGALNGDESEEEPLKERERGWNTGRPVPEPKKSDDNLKRRFSLGRRLSSSGHAKTLSDSASESDKKPNWAAKVLRAASKSKKDKDGSTDGTDATPEPLSIPDSRPSISIPDNVATDQRPLSAIVESPIASLNAQAILGSLQPVPPVVATTSPLANVTATAESPVEVKPEDAHSEPELVEAPVETPIEVAAARAAVLASPEPTDDTSPVEAAVVPPPPAEEAQPTVIEEVQPVTTEEAQPKPAEEAQPEAVEEVQPKAAEEVQPEVTEEAQPKDGSGTSTPAPIETEGLAAAPQNVLSPMSPNSPSSTPWDSVTQREIARARSPRRTSAGGPSNRSRVPSPAPSIIGVKRKQPDEPEIVKSRVRYLPDWAISPAIQLAVTLSLVLPRRRRDAANPTNRKRGWWPLRRSGPRTELRYNAIRGVNEEVPIVSKSWTVPAAVRTTAKVVTAPARWMFHLFVPRSNAH